MTPTNYETLKQQADAALRPLAEKVRKLSRHLDGLRRRAAAEAVELGKAEENLARFKGLAGEYLADGHGTFEKYKTGLRKALARLEMAVESTRIFERDLIPAASRDLDAAKIALSAAAARFFATSLPACESRMAALLDAVLAEADAFTSAFQELGKAYGCNFPKTPPVVRHARLGTVARKNTGFPWLTLLPAPTAPATTSPVAAVFVAAEAPKSTPTGEKALGVEEARPRPPEASVVLPGVVADRPTEAADPLGARARALRLRPPVVKTPQEPAPEAQTPPTDDLDDDAPDGPDDLGAEAEVPPDG